MVPKRTWQCRPFGAQSECGHRPGGLRPRLLTIVPLGLAHCMMLRGQVLLESVLRDLGVAVLSGFWLQDATRDSDPK